MLSGANVPCEDGQTTDILSVTLAPGIWIVIAMISVNVINSSDSRIRASIAINNMEISDQRASIDGFQTVINLSACVALETEGAVKIKVTQNSGGTNNSQCNQFVAIRISG